MTGAEVSALACRALRREVLLTPKPGLVDQDNSGAHTDMDQFTFLRSADALEPWFRKFFDYCAENRGLPPEKLLPQLRLFGLQAEKDMYRATGGVNTHKGALFSLGLLCAAAGSACENGLPLTADNLCALCRRMTCGLSDRELVGENTHGLAAHAHYGAKGVRGEAESGFESVRELALPVLRRAKQEGKTPHEAALLALLALMEQVHDTNVLHRAGQEGLLWMQRSSAALRADYSEVQLREFDRQCCEKNISPGGSADLLAITLFLEDIDFLYGEAENTLYYNS